MQRCRAPHCCITLRHGTDFQHPDPCVHPEVPTGTLPEPLRHPPPQSRGAVAWEQAFAEWHKSPHTPFWLGGWGSRGQKQVCVPEIGLPFRALSEISIFSGEQVFRCGWGGGGSLGCCWAGPQIPPPPGVCNLPTSAKVYIVLPVLYLRDPSPPAPPPPAAHLQVLPLTEPGEREPRRCPAQGDLPLPPTILEEEACAPPAGCMAKG